MVAMASVTLCFRLVMSSKNRVLATYSIPSVEMGKRNQQRLESIIFLWPSIQIYEHGKTSGHRRNHLTLRTSSRKRFLRKVSRVSSSGFSPLTSLIANIRVVRAVILKRLFGRTTLDRKMEQVLKEVGLLRSY